MLANVRDEYAFKIIDPAVPSDSDDPVRPKPLFVLSLALSVGVIAGLLVAAVLDTWGKTNRGANTRSGGSL